MVYFLLLQFLFVPIKNLIEAERFFVLEDTRTVALKWINETLPPGSVILREQYNPEAELLLNKNFKVIRATYYMYRYLNRSYLEKHSVNYVMLSSNMYGRYYRAPRIHREKITAYENLDNSYELMKEFNPSKHLIGYNVKIYRIK